MAESVMIVIVCLIALFVAGRLLALAVVGLAVRVSLRWAVRNGSDSGGEDDFAARLADHGGAP